MSLVRLNNSCDKTSVLYTALKIGKRLSEMLAEKVAWYIACWCKCLNFFPLFFFPACEFWLERKERMSCATRKFSNSIAWILNQPPFSLEKGHTGKDSPYEICQLLSNTRSREVVPSTRICARKTRILDDYICFEQFIWQAIDSMGRARWLDNKSSKREWGPFAW